jgi:hypothetical protein
MTLGEYLSIMRVKAVILSVGEVCGQAFTRVLRLRSGGQPPHNGENIAKPPYNRVLPCFAMTILKHTSLFSN